MIRPLILTAFVMMISGVMPLLSQTTPKENPLLPEEYDPEEFPQWAHDIRRFEVITFGVFPVAFFFTSLIYDATLSATHGFSSEYDLGSQREEEDIKTIIFGAAGVSIGVALADLIITLSKRNLPITQKTQAQRKAEREARRQARLVARKQALREK